MRYLMTLVAAAGLLFMLAGSVSAHHNYPTPSPSATTEPTSTPSASPSETPTATPSASPSETPAPSATPSETPVPSETPAPTPCADCTPGQHSATPSGSLVPPETSRPTLPPTDTETTATPVEQWPAVVVLGMLFVFLLGLIYLLTPRR